MPTVEASTARVLSGANVVLQGAGYRIVDNRSSPRPFKMGSVDEVVQFVRDLEQLCNDYFASQEKGRIANYEDIAYTARQIEDGLTSEYENPVLLPLNERLMQEPIRSRDELAGLAGATVDYIEDMYADCSRDQWALSITSPASSMPSATRTLTN
jgi:hypothetical protein